MNALRKEYFLIGVVSMPKMENAEKPKGRLFAAVLPSVWLLKLRSFRRKSRSLRATDISEPVIADSAPFLPKTVENIYKHGSEICTFSPLQGPQAKLISNPASPGPKNPVENAVTEFLTPSRKSIIRADGTTRATPVASLATTTGSGSSNFSRCMHRPAFFSSLKNLCKLVGDESLSTKSSSHSIQFRKTATPSMRAWFLIGCGGASRPRARHSSLDLEKESGLMDLDGDSGLERIDEGTGVEASWPKKSESWSGANTTSWNVDSSNDEVVKNQVVVKKKKFAKNRVSKGVKVKSPVELKSGSKPTLGHLFSTTFDTDSPKKVFPDTETESEIHIDNPKMVRLPWKSTSFGSDSTFRAPSVGSEYGLTFSESKPYICFPESEAPAAYTEEVDNGGNVSDSQSLLREKVLAAERLREGSKSWRDQRKVETKRNDAEAMKLLASLDQVLDQRNLKRLVEDEEDSGSMFGSPRFELHNSPVFESFLESSAKAWGIEIPTQKTDDVKTSGSFSDQSRELHCVTVQTASQLEKGRDQQAQEREHRGRETTRAVRVNSSSPAKARKVKRPVEKEVQKRPSPSRKPLPKNTREERTIHPQREESMVDPELHDEFNHARRKFNEARKRAKQRRSKQVASVPSPPAAAAPAPAPAPAPKERVAVVVESSYDPYNDFRQSMIEMIVDQDIHETGDLEELLQCYLSLNEPEYHNVIVDVFSDVWHELFESNS